MTLEETRKRFRLDNDRVESLTDAEQRMRILRKLKEKQRRVVNVARNKVRPITQQARNDIEMLQKDCELHNKDLRAWIDGHLKKSIQTKSIRILDGGIGYRIVGAGWDRPSNAVIVEGLQARGFHHLIRTTERPDMAVLKRPEYAGLREELGIIRRPGEDKFFSQIKGDMFDQLISQVSALEKKAQEAK